jgi:hypothetical protein
MSRRKSNISQLRCAGCKKSLEFDTTQGQDTSTNVNGVGHSFDGEPGMPLLWCLGYLLVRGKAAPGFRHSEGFPSSRVSGRSVRVICC